MPPTKRSGSATKPKGGKEQLDKLFNDINKTVKPYPKPEVQVTTLPLDGEERITHHRETPGGKVVKLVGVSSVGLLTAITLYGMISHDRELLFAVLDTARYALLALLAWALGKTVSRLLSKGGKDDEEKENSG